MEKITSAVFYTDGKYVLVCENTGSIDGKYDLPKGLIEKGETPQEAAVRELFEETGIKINKEDLNYIGTFKYNLSKDIALNLCIVNKLPKILDLKCTSLFTSKDGKQYPEIISYKYVYIGNISSYLRKNMMKAIKNSKIVDLARGEDNYE